MRLSQQMKLAPRIIQAMEILQLPMLALQERIDLELEKNPVLELRLAADEDRLESEPASEREEYTGERGDRPLVVKDEESHSEDFQRLADYTDEYGLESITSEAPPRSRASWRGERDRKMDAMANTPAPSESLDEYLLKQWSFVEAPDEIKAAGTLIINHIDADGYLRTPLEEIDANSDEPIPQETLREGLSLVQMLEPAGVGARDLRECLLLQLDADARAGMDVALEIELVSDFLKDIEMNRLPQIAKRTGRQIDQIKAAIENLSHLDPRPGSLIGQRSAPGIRPDAIVEVDSNGEIVVGMDAANSPRLRISKSYRRLARDRKTDREAKQFLQKNIRSAQWLMSAINQRRDTVSRVVKEVFEVQREFIERGSEALKPLPMADVAKKVGVHVATVSRAVAGKYVQTARGIDPLRMFFSGGMTTSGGQDVAWDAVRVKLKEVIDAEDKSKPLKDEAVAARLAAQGMSISRRTVAKYRKLLDIPPARKRKQWSSDH